VIQVLQTIPVDRALLIVFLAGQLYSQFKGMRASQRSQGERIGVLEERVAKLEAKVT
jgi:hypothetical protein